MFANIVIITLLAFRVNSSNHYNNTVRRKGIDPVLMMTAGPKIVCFLTQSVQLTLSSVQLTLLKCVM